mmetsp:Transcript_145305/g.256145  ORF Transcript_145305/g.256145 Transcript_145305/m.256145 type:complete len:1585 (+) Transcript_145305:42-4796(+)
MNEFAQLLLLIWRIVIFFLDLASYLICTALLIIACILPWRAFTIWKEADYLDRGKCICYFFRTVWECFCLCVCLPSLTIPSRMIGFVRLFAQAEYYRELFDDQVVTGYTLWYLASPFLGIAEVAACGMGLIALLTIVRSCQTLYEACHAWHVGDWNDASFNSSLVEVLVSNCMLTLVDIAFLPLIIALLVTMYRAPVVLRELQKGSGDPQRGLVEVRRGPGPHFGSRLRKAINWKIRAVILEQFARLVTDLILVAPSYVLVIVTIYRLPSLLRRLKPIIFTRTYQSFDDVEMAFNREGRSEEGTEKAELCCFTRMQLWPMKSAGLILLDLLCSPLILLLLLTVYRFRAITLDLHGIRFHKAVVQQTCELLIDTPFVFAGVLVVCTLYRADLALLACRIDAQTAWERRLAVGKQFLRLVGDIASLIPFSFLVCTLYRICPLALNLKAQLVQLLREEPEMRLLEWRLSLPRPKGRPGFIVNAAKSANLHGITSMQLQVVGAEFWAAVAQARGGLVAAAGRAMLPLRLRHGKEVDFDVFKHGCTEVTLQVELDFNVKQTTVLRFLEVLPVDAEVLLQLEAGLANGRQAVLLAVPCKIADLAAAARSDNFAVEAAEVMAENLAALRGIPICRRDVWLPLVMTEFSQVLLDIVHFCLALGLIAVPWRFFEAMNCFLQPTPLRYAQRACRALVALEGWSRACNTVLSRTELLCNRYAKAAAEASSVTNSTTRHRGMSAGSPSNIEKRAEECVAGLCCIFCLCCPNYNDWDPEDWELVRNRTRRYSLTEDFDRKIRAICAPLRFYRTQLRSARKAWPDDPEWALLESEMDTYIQRRSLAFFWMLLLHEVHILVTRHRITKEEHTRFAQAVRNRALPLVKGAELELDQLWGRFETQRNKAAEGRYRCKNKSKILLYAILREQFMRALTDLIAIPMILLLVVTMYRLPQIRKAMGKSMEHLKMAIKVEGLQLAIDFWRLLQLSVLTLLLIVTVVKLPDFLSSLRPSYGLRKLRDCALAAVSELVVGIGELLLMITAWKTYRLLVSAVIFAVLCPAAMLAMTLPPLMKNENRFQEVPVEYYQAVIKNCDKNVVMDQGQKVEKGTRCRLFVASLFWFVILFAGIWASAPYVLFCFDIILVLAFSGLCFNKSPGWLRPRGGMDWWSSVCRMTFPNLLAVTAILSEAVVLALVGRSCMAEGWLEEKETAGTDRFAIFAFSTVAAAILLETIPMVSSENEQISVITSHAWRAGTMITKDVLLFPVVLVLSGRLSEHWLYSVALLFYTVIILLSSAVWDVDLPYESLLDVRCSGLNMGGRRLLTMAAVQAGLSGNNGLFLSFMVASAAWTTMWAPFASSTPWAEVLRLGASAGGLAAATLGLFPTFLTWISAFIIGLLTAFGSWLLRKRALAASKIPSAMQHCVDMEKCLRLWGDTTLPRLRVDADVRSTARRVLEFEDRLPVERLDLDFFAGRHAWRSGLADAPDYETVLLHIERLKTAISVPVTRILVQQVLARMTLFGKRQLDRPLATEIAKFVVPPVDFKLPQPLKGWEFGDLDLAALRQHAEREAAKIPMLIRSKAAGPTTIGRQAGPLLDFRF